VLYAGGYFSPLLSKSPATSAIGEPYAPFIAGVDLTTGIPTALHPAVDGNLYAMVAASHTLYAGGAFGSIDGLPQMGLAAFTVGTVNAPPPAGPTPLHLAMAPSPFTGSAKLAYSLPQDEVVTIGLHDVRGRQVATIVDRERRGAGPHAETFDGSALRAGVYFLRLDAGERHASLKVVRTR
jgi:hypothetical protein